MLPKYYRYTCPTMGIRVIVTKQTFPAIAGDVSHQHSDYDCSHQGQCDRRHDKACKIYCLNPGEEYSQP